RAVATRAPGSAAPSIKNLTLGTTDQVRTPIPSPHRQQRFRPPSRAARRIRRFSGEAPPCPGQSGCLFGSEFVGSCSNFCWVSKRIASTFSFVSVQLIHVQLSLVKEEENIENPFCNGNWETSQSSECDVALSKPGDRWLCSCRKDPRSAVGACGSDTASLL
uniref:Uncharacterized protein n=1 Tax=Aegilops tauschii subsp. strangulata TaxID=200361 RepID=A0A453H212_AEGTS